jgi:tubulin-specific chaperone A
MADPRKTLRIKTGVVKRLAKEKVSYEKEAGEQRQRIQIYKDQGNYVAPSHL